MARGLPNLPQSYPNDQKDSSVSQRQKTKVGGGISSNAFFVVEFCSMHEIVIIFFNLLALLILQFLII